MRSKRTGFLCGLSFGKGQVYYGIMFPDLTEEKKLWKKGYKRVFGLDEVGRGALCGPVVAAAVLTAPGFSVSEPEILKKIRDSKKLSGKKRRKFYKILTNHPKIRWATGRVYQKGIDRINIFEATRLAMERAVNNLNSKFQNPKHRADYLILDGRMNLNLPVGQKSIIKADEKVFSCAAASILAKVQRDRLMEKYHRIYPCYGLEKHKGYATRHHLKMLKMHGPCLIHRKSFGSLRSCQNKRILID
jgi:ribonuclease HII